MSPANLGVVPYICLGSFLADQLPRAVRQRQGGKQRLAGEIMLIEKLDARKRALQQQRALARWDNDGGAGPSPTPRDVSSGPRLSYPTMGEAELNTLHVRLLAQENLIIALLADASANGRARARNIAASIVPQEGSTRHPLTVHAASHMLNLVERAERYGD